MNLTLQFQELENLIVELTRPPVTPMLRAKLHRVIEQVEALVADKANGDAELTALPSK